MASILIADDEPNVRALLRLILSPSYRVIEAADGAAALALATQHLPAVAILDVAMPHLTGNEVCRRLRNGATTGEIRIIVITANGGADDRATALAAGADHFLRKPFSPAILLGVVKSLMADVESMLA